MNDQFWRQPFLQAWDKVAGQVNYEIEKQLGSRTYILIEKQLWGHFNNRLRTDVWDQMKEDTNNE